MELGSEVNYPFLLSHVCVDEPIDAQKPVDPNPRSCACAHLLIAQFLACLGCETPSDLTLVASYLNFGVFLQVNCWRSRMTWAGNHALVLWSTGFLRNILGKEVEMSRRIGRFKLSLHLIPIKSITLNQINAMTFSL